ncbi:hypothetical protein QTP88_003714 [Uroleucon formosanum]
MSSSRSYSSFANITPRVPPPTPSRLSTVHMNRIKNSVEREALNLAWIIVGETYDVASSHAFRTKLLDQRQAPRTSIGGGWTGAHQLLRLGGWRDRKKRSLKLFPVGFGRIIADIRAALSVRQYPPVVIASNNLFSAEFALNNNSISSSVHTAAAEVISVSSRQRRANESCAKFETARLRLTARPYNPPTIRTRAVKPWPIYHNIKKVIDRCTSSLREEE